MLNTWFKPLTLPPLGPLAAEPAGAPEGVPFFFGANRGRVRRNAPNPLRLERGAPSFSAFPLCKGRRLRSASCLSVHRHPMRAEGIPCAPLWCASEFEEETGRLQTHAEDQGAPSVSLGVPDPLHPSPCLHLMERVSYQASSRRRLPQGAAPGPPTEAAEGFLRKCDLHEKRGTRGPDQSQTKGLEEYRRRLREEQVRDAEGFGFTLDFVTIPLPSP